jgi:hypothetical protein
MLRIILSNGIMKCNINTSLIFKSPSWCTWILKYVWLGWKPWHQIVTVYHFYISDDKVHDNLLLQHCFGLHKQCFESQGHPLPIEHIVFSNGCSSQFKCGKSFVLCCMVSIINQMSIIAFSNLHVVELFW